MREPVALRKAVFGTRQHAKQRNLESRHEPVSYRSKDSKPQPSGDDIHKIDGAILSGGP